MTACEVAVTPTFFPASSSARIRPRAAVVLPLPGGPWMASTSPSSASPSRTIGVGRRLALAQRRSRGNAPLDQRLPEAVAAGQHVVAGRLDRLAQARRCSAARPGPSPRGAAARPPSS